MKKDNEDYKEFIRLCISFDCLSEELTRRMYSYHRKQVHKSLLQEWKDSFINLPQGSLGRPSGLQGDTTNDRSRTIRTIQRPKNKL